MKSVFTILLAFSFFTSCQSKQVYTNNHIKEEVSRTVANDSSDIDLIYVSSDGKYIGFFESVIQDGSGFPVVAFRVLDIAKDKFIINQELREETEADKNSISNLKNKLISINSRKITSLNLLDIYKNPYSVSKLVKEVALVSSTSVNNIEKNIREPRGTFTYKGKDYSYVVQPVSIPNENPKIQFCGYFEEDDSKLNGFSILLNNKEVYKDIKYPKSRGCAYTYWINRVIFVKDKPVFFVRYSRLGFEGPDYRTITVSIKE